MINETMRGYFMWYQLCFEEFSEVSWCEVLLFPWILSVRYEVCEEGMSIRSFGPSTDLPFVSQR